MANISIRRGLLRRRPSDTKGSFLAGWDRSSGLILQRGLAAFGCRNVALKLVWRRTVTGPKLSTPDRSHEGAADREPLKTRRTPRTIPAIPKDNRQSVYGQRANGECQCVLANHEVAESRAPPQQSAREAPGLRGERERKRASRLYPLASLHATHGSAV